MRLQSRMIPVRAGIQIIRYESAQDPAAAPVVLLQPWPADNLHVTLMTSKDGQGASLHEPGDVIVVRATRDVQLVATTASVTPCTAVLKIERLGQRGTTPGHGEPTATLEIVRRN